MKSDLPCSVHAQRRECGTVPAAEAAACFCFAISFLLRSVDPCGIFTFSVCSSSVVVMTFCGLLVVTLTPLLPNLEEGRHVSII